MAERLPSWRPGATRESVLSFLDAARDVPVEDRFACFDNDGTLWCERPSYLQFDFFIHELKEATSADPVLADKPEFAALINHDKEAQGDLGLARIAMALAGLFEGLTPEEFTQKVRSFMNRAVHADTGRPMMKMAYSPMLELLSELRALDFTVSIVSGGGTEFVRAISQELYGVAPELVVGTLIAYTYSRDERGVPQLTRKAKLGSSPNEGANKVAHMQAHLGRRPILAGGNSSGDREMLEWAAGGDGPTLALLIDHDDADREYSYISLGATTSNDEPITEVGARLGWTVISMRNDWEVVFV